MVDPALVRLSLAEAAALIQRREVSPAELLDAVLARIAAVDPRLNAFTTLVPVDEARAAARAAEHEIAAGRYRGPLHGIPAGVKDLIDTAGLRTTYGSGMFRDHVPAADGAVPERLRAAGAIIVGKTATHEFGRGVTTNNYFFGPTRNPWNLDHVPGGSSGGAAAATAALLGSLHVGTDGGGSIRVPAAFCGVVGLKPTLGLISNRGHTGGGDSSFSVPGPLARTVRDAAIVAQALAGFDPAYAYSRPGPVPDLLEDLEAGVDGLCLGTSPDVFRPHPAPAVRTTIEATLGRLRALGARVVEVPMPHHELVLPVVMAMFAIEGEVALEARLGDRPRRLSPQVARMREMTPVLDAAGWVSAQRERQLVCRDYAAAFAEVDALVLPAVPFTAPRIETDDETRLAGFCAAYTGAANLTGLPAVALPAGTSGGLPLGVQIVAAAGRDGFALRIARALEKTAAEHRVHPPPDGG
ncbi:MAG: amidase [Deltaproteobacteria bacterium]|nr:MAG: amidase [Deltaproteobacteria bacterium]